MPNCLINDERKEFSDACEMNVDERYWLQYCYAVYVEENAVKLAGYGCFEDHWLAKSVESITLGGSGTELNGGLDEAEAIALLLSLKDNDPGKGSKLGPSNSANDELKLAISASLGKVPPKKVVPQQVDLDEEFNDQLAIALMMSAEESSKSGKSSGETEAEELVKDEALAEMSTQVESHNAGANGLEQPTPSADTNADTTTDIRRAEESSSDGVLSQNNDGEDPGPSSPIDNTSHPTEEQSAEDETLQTNDIEESGNSDPHTESPLLIKESKGKDPTISEEVADPTPTNEEDYGTLEHLINNQPPSPPPKDTKGKHKLLPSSHPQVTHQPPQIPSRTSSSQPSDPPTSDPQTSTNNQLHIPSKLHFLSLYSTKATGSLSYLGLSATVYTVLFLRAAGEREGRRVFERVGVGKIIEKGFFGSAKMETAVLV
jgi:hypothetical protein